MHKSVIKIGQHKRSMLHASLKTSFLYYLLSGLNANEANKCFDLRTYEIFQLTFLDFAFKLNQLFIWFSMHYTF